MSLSNLGVVDQKTIDQLESDKHKKEKTMEQEKEERLKQAHMRWGKFVKNEPAVQADTFGTYENSILNSDNTHRNEYQNHIQRMYPQSQVAPMGD